MPKSNSIAIGLAILAMIGAGKVGATDSQPNNCKDEGAGTGTWYVLGAATISSVLVADQTHVFVKASQGSCEHTFYFPKSNKELLAAVLTARANGTAANLKFYSDQGSPDVNYNGEIGTHQLGAISF